MTGAITFGFTHKKIISDDFIALILSGIDFTRLGYFLMAAHSMNGSLTVIRQSFDNIWDCAIPSIKAVTHCTATKKGYMSQVS